MNRRTRGFVTLALASALAVLPLAGCASKASSPATAPSPAKVEAIGDTGIKRLTLTEKAVQRLAVATVPVIPEAAGKTVVPYGALLYLPNGKPFVYTNPEGTSYVRQDVAVESITGQKVVLTSGPAVGTQVVTAGGAELWGTEFGVK